MADVLMFPLGNTDYDEDSGQYWLGTRSNGIFTEGDFDISPTNPASMSISVARGVGWLNYEWRKGVQIVSPQTQTFEIATASPVYGRIDNLVLRYNIVENKGEMLIVTGTPASTPVAAAPTRNGQMYELVRARITVAAGATSITAADITDCALDEDLCGIMRDGVTAIPTATLDAAFESWFNATKEEWENWWTGQSGGIAGYMLQDTYDSAKTGALFVKATHAKVGTVHKLTVPSTVAKAIWFLATATFEDGDTIQVNDTAQTLQLINGEEVPGEFFVQGAEVSCFKNNDTLTFGGGGSMGKWKFITAATLPATVAKNTFVALTATTPTTITVGDTAPSTPANGDVWYNVVDPSGGDVNSDGTVPFRCLASYQWNGTEWTSLTSFYAWLDNWREVAGLPPAGGDLADYTWDEINRIGALGRAAEYFSIGEMKDVSLSTGEVITLVLVGLNSDPLASDPTTYAPYSFHMLNCLNTTRRMEATNTNVNSWSGCEMRTTTLPAILLTLPTELQGVIKTVLKKTSAGNQSSSIITTNDKLWLASEIEIFGTLTHSKSGEGSQYPYYATSGNRIKSVANTAAIWWERSPRASDAASFCGVRASGAASNDGASASYGVASGLCV